MTNFRKNYESVREIADSAARYAIEQVLPERALKEALSVPIEGETIVLVSIGKAAWRMANAAHEILGARIKRGCVITKDGHSMGRIGELKIFEASHPVPEPRNIEAAKYAVSTISGLTEHDAVLFLISGGGSALFELPSDGVSLDDIADMTSQLLACGANIVEINTLRKRVSSVKGGRFAKECAPARVHAIVLSDVLGDRLDSIASGPAYPDSSTCEDALAIVRKYGLRLPRNITEKLSVETPKELDNVVTRITGSGFVMCEAAQKFLTEKGYAATLLTTTLDCEASEAGSLFAALAREAVRTRERRTAPVAFIAGGECVVKIKGKGKGGRCQETALAAAIGIKDTEGVAFAAIGSDGTDGPTDAAGGLVDGATFRRIQSAGLDASAMLSANDSYHALDAAQSLFVTGPTGTNVNDLFILLAE